MSTPPTFTSTSARRLDAVMEATIDRVEAGESPNVAIAKSAAAYGLPCGHVPLAVRAYNNGRSARQLASSTDPWERAASYEPATVDGVTQALQADAAPPQKAASYLPPPVREAPKSVDFQKLAAGFGTPADEWIKAAAEKGEASKVVLIRTNTAKPVAAIEALGTAATLLDGLAETLKSAADGEYVGVKVLALQRFPDTAPFVFSRLEARHPALVKKAAALPDPATPANHAVLPVIAALEKLRATPKSNPLPVKKANLAMEAAGEVLPTLAFQEPATAVKPNDEEDEDEIKAASFASGWNSGTALMGKIPTLVPGRDRSEQTSPLTGKYLNFISNRNDWQAEKQKAYQDAARDAFNNSLKLDVVRNKAVGGLPAESSNLADQESINNLLIDSRLSKADPGKVVEAYRQLSGIAPTVMRNPAVAGDFVNRVIQTGPLGYHDLGQLAKIEKDFLEGNRLRNDDDD